MSKMTNEEAVEVLSTVSLRVLADDADIGPVVGALSKAITALKASGEPVAWAYVNSDGECEQIEWGPVYDDPHVTPLYAAPPAPTVTDDAAIIPNEPTEEIIEAMNEAYRSTRRTGAGGMTIDSQWRREYAPEIAAYRAILAALGEGE